MVHVEVFAIIAMGEEKSGDWAGAGVVPYVVQHDATGCGISFLLGKELQGLPPSASRTTHVVTLAHNHPVALAENSKSKRLYFWSDFGGRRQAGDATPAHTAAREFAEETLGMYAVNPRPRRHRP